jgi:hypothetical protein
VGEVVASKSDRFAVGDTALALPASYFKGHAGYKTDWYQEEVHGVLLEPFPVQQVIIFGTALQEKIGVFHSSSLKMVPETPNAP